MSITPMSPAEIVYTILINALELYKWIVIAAIVMSWLFAFNVVNYHNNIVRSLARFLDALTEPVFRLGRRIIPPIGGLDLSPIIILVAIWVLQVFVVPWLVILLARLTG